MSECVQRLRSIRGQHPGYNVNKSFTCSRAALQSLQMKDRHSVLRLSAKPHGTKDKGSLSLAKGQKVKVR